MNCVLCQLGLVVLRVGIALMHQIVLAILFLVLLVVLLVFMVTSVSRLAKALGLSQVFYAILMFVPCVSLLALLSLSGKATSRLQQAGIKVGLMGADPNTI